MNRLQYEKSPYLLQHADNPVDWYPWGTEAFETARKEDKPVFLSVGYSTCHWCHVMAHESFADQEAAEAINRFFVPVKVDREERPDVDAVYMAACVALNGSGGWPLTVLLSADQKPFWAGTYLPKAQLLYLLKQVSYLWREDREKLLSMGETLTESLRQERDARSGAPSRALVESGVDAFSVLFDSQWGGFGHAPKFPSAHNLLFLLRYAETVGNSHAAQMAASALEHMYRGGLFDHVGGGFSRYSTDRRWLVPHFEKTLYDNALLALAYAEGWRQTKRPYCRYAAARTLDYILSELSNPAGGFFCGQDADSNGVEGKYYVFSPDELSEPLGENAEYFCHVFGIDKRGNFEGKSIPNLINTENWEKIPETAEELLKIVCRYRKKRTPLNRDDKILTAWNGLTVAALARCGLVLNEPRCLEAATRTVCFIEEHLRVGENRLLARWRDGNAAYPGKLEDYAFYAWGLLELYETTFHMEFLEKVRELMNTLSQFFFDTKDGGFYPYASDGEQLITRTKDAYDGAMPSGNAVTALVLSRLARLTGERKWREAAELQFRYLAGAIPEYPAGHAFTLLAMIEELWPAGELICTARETPRELIPILRERPGLAVLIKTEKNRERMAILAPFTRAYPLPKMEARYYFCRNGRCERPVDTIEELTRLLQDR